jgi:hypothetical protein
MKPKVKRPRRVIIHTVDLSGVPVGERLVRDAKPTAKPVRTAMKPKGKPTGKRK